MTKSKKNNFKKENLDNNLAEELLIKHKDIHYIEKTINNKDNILLNNQNLIKTSSNSLISKVEMSDTSDLINKKLPKELLIRVFSYLDVISLCRCAQVSKVALFV